MQLAHGADPYLKNQEGQAPVDLASADDVRCLLQDATATQQIMSSTDATSSSRPPSIALSQSCSSPVLPGNTETVIMPSGASMTLSVPVASRSSVTLSPAEGCSDSCKGENEMQDAGNITNIATFLSRYVEKNIHFSFSKRLIILVWDWSIYTNY